MFYNCIFDRLQMGIEKKNLEEKKERFEKFVV